ncbi:FMN-dependent oxidoreductase (nitrilotriacetate monooxygenase family) [Humitalea rosea]|uniref:FMN-dependent oxidoreductase (Nitrilotriacetate monooxygenase family) n=1 Tax=Humitalea rosea TaxID=990373 RepID=A0A2W7II82_9PROT|nr:LLM class flavin-dependent oxidoreductase [Humitalea rosea]PZW37689.1 FMN-dependent oxidoreductase (nitrilotriacetate monooxygenase family) [Humitalea rosea]
MTARRMMKLGLSVASAGYHYSAWCHPEVDALSATSIQHHVRAARIAERGKMDFLFLADWSSILNVDDRRIARDREQAQVKVDPTLAMAAVAAVTSHVGLMPTASTTYWHPFNFARRMAALDHISGGRAAWNMVTSHGLDEARNFGLDKPLDSNTRHERAREFVSVMRGLWDSWDDDAFIRDKQSGRYFDRDKVHVLDHVGKHFRVRGPLDAARPPQGFLPIITAGTSENSQDLAAEIADMCYGGQPNVEAARAYYSSVKGRLAKYGRTPDELLMLPGIQCYVGRTQSEAEDKFALMQRAMPVEVGIGQLIVNHFPDLTGHPLDEPIPDLTMRDEFLGSEKLGGREPELTLALMRRARDEKLTLRQLFDVALCGFWSLGVIGTPKLIADMMEEWFTTGAADGFNVQPPYLPGGGEDFVDLVIPELQRRGLFRTEYEGRTLRENLGLKRPPSRYATRLTEAAE